MPPTGVIILCHGSRGEQGIIEVPKTLRRVTAQVKTLLPPEVEVTGAALQFNHPNLEEAVEFLAVRDVLRIIIMPYFLFPGRHITEDIPRLVEKLKRTYPQSQFTVTKPLGLEENFTLQLAQCLEKAVPELWAGAPVPAMSPDTIEKQSMEIVEKLLPPTLKTAGDERLIVKRIVHASGDPQVAGLVHFSPSAVPSGLGALAKGSPIFTDVQMVAAGISRQMVKACGCSLACAMDTTGRQKQTEERDTTRAAAAMRRLGKRLDRAIAVIGNAPTALISLLTLIDNNGIKPALVVGMPVGFVQARESKEALMKHDVPYITIVGTRGGSAMAVATVNALLKMALERSGRDSDG